MGLCDDIEFTTPSPIKCAAGHEQTETQTKDLECAMNNYIVIDGQAYQVDKLTFIKEHETDADGKHWIHWRQPLAPLLLNGVVEVHTSCEECLPVLTFRGGTAWGDGVQEHEPRVEVAVTFKDGRVEGVADAGSQTREDVRKQVLGWGHSDLLEDDERLAKRHFQIRQERGK